MVVVVGQGLTGARTYRRRTRAGCYKRRPCTGINGACGGETVPGRGHTLCQVCAAEREAHKLCAGCGAEKGTGPGHRYCARCYPKQPRAGDAQPCHACGSRVRKTLSMRYCDECAPVIKEAQQIRRRARCALKRKPCWGCGKPKGSGRRVYCDPCQTRRAAPRVCPEPGCENVLLPRKKACEPCKARKQLERRADYLRKMRADPERHEHFKAYYRAYHHNVAKKRKRSKKERVTWVACSPLAAALYIEAGRDWQNRTNLGREEDGGPMEDRVGGVAARAGVNPRTVSAWFGERKKIKWEVADAVLLNMDWHWWDVYDPELASALYSPLEWIDVVDQACKAWTGERCL